MGALFASPIAGVLQALIVALWTNWRATHPEQFEQVKQQVADKVDESLTDCLQKYDKGRTSVVMTEGEQLKCIIKKKKNAVQMKLFLSMMRIKPDVAKSISVSTRY